MEIGIKDPRGGVKEGTNFCVENVFPSFNLPTPPRITNVVWTQLAGHTSIDGAAVAEDESEVWSLINLAQGIWLMDPTDPKPASSPSSQADIPRAGGNVIPGLIMSEEPGVATQGWGNGPLMNSIGAISGSFSGHGICHFSLVSEVSDASESLATGTLINW